MWRVRFAALAVACSAGLLSAADEKKRTLAEDAQLLGAAGGTGWLTEPVPVTVGGEKDKFRLAVHFRPEKDGAKGRFVLGLVAAGDKDAKSILNPMAGTFELAEKDGRRVVDLTIGEAGMSLTIRAPYTATDKSLTLPDGLGTKGWFDDTDKKVRVDADALNGKSVAFVAK